MSFWSSITSGLEAVGHFAADHWKEIAVVAATTIVFAGVLVLTGGTAALLAPTLAQLALAGVASGAAGQVLGDLLDGRAPTIGGVIKAAVIGGVITVATAGLGRFVPGLARPLTNPIAQRAVIATAGSVGGAGAQVMSNAIDGKPLLANVGEAAARGGVTTLLASEGVRLVTPLVVRSGGPPIGTPRGREILPEPVAQPALTVEEAAAIAKAAAEAKARELRSPGGDPVTKKALDGVPRGASAMVDRTNGEVTVGVTGGPLNAKMAEVFAEQGIDLATLQRNLDAKGLQDAMTNPAIRTALGAPIADQIRAMNPADLIGTEANKAGTKFLALPWNCAEMQAQSAALAKGSNPADLVSSTARARENNPLNAGNPFKSCPRCEAIQNGTGVFNASDAGIASHTHTSDTTVPAGTTTTSDTTVGATAPAVSKTPGFAKALDRVGE